MAYNFTSRGCPSRQCNINSKKRKTKETRGKDGRTNFTLGVKVLTLGVYLYRVREDDRSSFSEDFVGYFRGFKVFFMEFRLIAYFNIIENMQSDFTQIGQ